MKDKKLPERFSIRFDTSIPEHRQVIEILAKKGRNTARYIADAVTAYESNKNSLEATVTEVVTKILGLNNIHNEDAISASDIPASDFDFNEVLSDLDGFKNE